MDEGEENVDVDGFGDEGQVADREGALAVLFTRVTGDTAMAGTPLGREGSVTARGVDSRRRPAYRCRKDDVRAVRDGAAQSLCR